MTNIKQLTKIAMMQKEEEESKANKNKPLGKGEDFIPHAPIANTYKTSRKEQSTIRTEKNVREVPKNTPSQKEEPAEQKPKKPSIFKKMHDFNFYINKENAPKHLPFILYTTLWIMLYIANHHYGEKTLLQINHMNKDMKDLKADYYTSNAELSNKSIQSQVLKMVDTIGLKELRTPPHRLKLIKEDEH